MSEFRHFRLDRDERGVGTVTLDVVGSAVNIFNTEVMTELARLVELLEADPPSVAVFRSGKASGFLAGADIHHLRKLATAAEVEAVLSDGQGVFARLERLPFPTVAVIHGPCLGGGLEFALALRHRVARDDGPTRLGLPEVQLGLIPGWGGTQRLPRLVGLRTALRLILEGNAVSAARAAEIGLVDAAFPPASFEADVNRFVEDVRGGRPVRRPARRLTDKLLEGTWPGRKVILAAARRQVGKRAAHYPAVTAALRAIEASTQGSPESGYAAERREFAAVVFTPAARNLIGIFVGRERARKRSTWVSEEVRPLKVERVVVVGGGTMGSGIAQLLALNGFSVVLKEVSGEAAAAAAKRVESLTSRAVAKGALSRADADAVARAVTVTAEWPPAAGCTLAIEAVVEREEVKRAVFSELAGCLGPTAVLATNTSALSVSRIADATPRPERVAGLHFFNPVHKMPLVEVVRGRQTSDEVIATLVELVRKLGKVPVVVADSPGFLVNRILFPYLDEAVRLVLEGVRAEEVDRAALGFGMPMGPLELLDQIGIDIAADVAKTFAALATEPGPVPDHFAAMVAAGATGVKAGKGFYHHADGKRGRPSEWAAPRGPDRRVESLPNRRPGEPTRPGSPSAPLAPPLTPLARRLVYPMLNEAARCLESGIVSEPDMIDLAMVLGTGFAPFRGGPLRLADAIGCRQLVTELDALSADLGPRFRPCELLRSLASEGRGIYAEAKPALASA